MLVSLYTVVMILELLKIIYNNYIMKLAQQDNSKASVNTLQNILHIDKIRISKLLHYCQSSIIMFIIAFILGTLIEKVFILPTTKINNFQLLTSLFIQLSINTIAIYYLKKISFVVPSKFALTDKYINSLHNEALYGGLVGSGLILLRTQRSLYQKLEMCIERFSF